MEFVEPSITSSEEAASSKTISEGEDGEETTDSSTEEVTEDYEDETHLRRFDPQYEEPKANETTEERNQRIRRFMQLVFLGSIELEHSPSGKPYSDFTEEEKSALKTEFQQSVDDLIKMMDFVHSFELETNLNNDGPKSSPIVKQIQELIIISWDVGHHWKYIGTRAEAVADLILKEAFDIAFLQEVNPLVFKYLRSRLSDQYEILFNPKHIKICSFNNLTLVRRDTVTVISNKTIYFANTREKRTLMKTDVSIGNKTLCLLNTHLEGLIHNSKYRMQQMQKCFDVLQAVPKTVDVILCGSFNIREWEFRKLREPKNIIDVWQKCGAKKHTEFTWDLTINKLIQMPIQESRRSKQPQKRFDRIYFRSTQSVAINPISFDLLGKDLVAVDKYFPSDHWALVSRFSVSDQCYLGKKRSDNNDASNSCSKIASVTLDFLEGEDHEIRGEKKSSQEKVKENWDDSSDED